MSFPWFKPVSPWEKEQEERAVAEAMARYIEAVILGRVAAVKKIGKSIEKSLATGGLDHG